MTASGTDERSADAPGGRRRAAPRVLAAAAAALVAILLVVGLLQGGSSGDEDVPAPDLRAVARHLAGGPPALARLYARGGVLLPDEDGERLLRSLRGHPVVVNVWGSWCGPCRREFPLLRLAAARHGTRIAFLGVDAEGAGGGSAAAARAFLAEQPTPYPHLVDAKAVLARRLGAGFAYPTTVFLDRRGRIVQVKQGPYERYAELEDALRRYASAGRPGARDEDPARPADPAGPSTADPAS